MNIINKMKVIELQFEWLLWIVENNKNRIYCSNQMKDWKWFGEALMCEKKICLKPPRNWFHIMLLLFSTIHMSLFIVRKFTIRLIEENVQWTQIIGAVEFDSHSIHNEYGWAVFDPNEQNICHPLLLYAIRCIVETVNFDFLFFFLTISDFVL